MQGIIFDIKHYAIHDGPGIRQTIFFKGCPLGCWWCHNPESRSPEIFSYQKEEKLDQLKIQSRETIGRQYSVPELMTEVLKDQVLFEESGGGVTISGGEPLMQFDFLMDFLKACKNQDIHSCLDTTALTDTSRMQQIIPWVDLFLIDVKQVDDQKHTKYTGVSNEKILENIRMLDQNDQDIWFRYPLIPGMNDDEADLLRMMAFLKSLKKQHPISILPYHKIGSQKYDRFGIDYKMDGIEEPTEKKLSQTQQYFENAGFEVKIGG